MKKWKFREQHLLLCLGFLAGSTVGTSIVILIMTDWAIDGDSAFNALIGFTAAIFAYLGVDYQIQKHREQQRRDHQYQVLARHRLAFRDIFIELKLSHQNLVAFIEGQSFAEEWVPKFPHLAKNYDALISLSSQLAQGIYLISRHLNCLLAPDTDWKNLTKKQKVALNELNRLWSPYLESLQAAIIENKLPNLPEENFSLKIADEA